MKKQYIYIGLAVLAVGGLYWWSKNKNQNTQIVAQGTQEYNFDVNSLEYAAFEDGLMQKYKIGGRPNNGDVITTAYGTYTFTMTKAGVAPAYYPDGYWSKS